MRGPRRHDRPQTPSSMAQYIKTRLKKNRSMILRKIAVWAAIKQDAHFLLVYVPEIGLLQASWLLFFNIFATVCFCDCVAIRTKKSQIFNSVIVKYSVYVVKLKSHFRPHPLSFISTKRTTIRNQIISNYPSTNFFARMFWPFCKYFVWNILYISGIPSLAGEMRCIYICKSNSSFYPSVCSTTNALAKIL